MPPESNSNSKCYFLAIITLELWLRCNTPSGHPVGNHGVMSYITFHVHSQTIITHFNFNHTSQMIITWEYRHNISCHNTRTSDNCFNDNCMEYLTCIIHIINHCDRCFHCALHGIPYNLRFGYLTLGGIGQDMTNNIYCHCSVLKFWKLALYLQRCTHNVPWNSIHPCAASITPNKHPSILKF